MNAIRCAIQQKNSRTLLLTLLVFMIVGGAWLAGSIKEHDPQDVIPSDLNSALLPEPQSLKAFRLTDQQGRIFDLDRLRGKWTFMFFGYTRCPDICPTTLVVMQSLAEVLERDPRNIAAQFVFVSLDPEYDKPENLGIYVEYFNPEFIGITGSQAQLDFLGRQLNIESERIERDGSANHLLSHTSSIMLVDPEARWYADFSPPHERAGIIKRFFLGHHLYQQEKR